MITKKLIDVSHLLMILGGISVIIFGFRYPIIWCLLILGWIGFHLRQAKRTGWLGHVGFALILIPSTLPALLSLLGFYRTYSIGSSFSLPDPQSLVLLLIIMGVQVMGLLIYGMVTYRAKILPSGISIFLFIWIIFQIVIGNFGVGFCLAVIGFELWRSRNNSLSQATAEPRIVEF